MYTAGVRFHLEETLQLIYLTAEVMQRHFRQVSAQHAYHPEGSIKESKLPPDRQQLTERIDHRQCLQLESDQPTDH